MGLPEPPDYLKAKVKATLEHGGYTLPNGKRARMEYWEDEGETGGWFEIISSDIPGVGFQAVEDIKAPGEKDNER
jgi:hypothetical protein